MKTKNLTQKQKITTSLIALAFVLGTVVFVPQAFAFGDSDSKAYFNQTREAIHEAITNNDYDAFVSLASDTPFADSISEETFARLVEAHALREAGDLEGARAIMQEIGISHVGHRGMFRGDEMARIELTDEQIALREERHAEKLAHREAVQDAIEAEDYDAWLALVENKPVAEIVNEDNFDEYVDAYELRQSGDKEGFKEAKEALGFDFSHKGERFRSGGGLRTNS